MNSLHEKQNPVLMFAAAVSLWALPGCSKAPPASVSVRSGPEVSPRVDPAAVAQANPVLLPGDSVFRGRVGGREVVIELRLAGDRIGGRYYDLENKLSVLVGGTKRGGSVELSEYAADAGTIFGKESAAFTLTEEGGRLVGVRRALDGGEPHSVVLDPSEKGSYGDSRNGQGSLEWSQDRSFSYRRLVRFEEHWVYCADHARPPVDPELIVGLHEECFHLFESAQGFRAVIEGALFRIESVHQGFESSLVGKEFGEEIPQPGESWGGEFEAEVVFARGRVLTYRRSTSGLYTAAYPAHDEIFVTVDLRTGEPMTMESSLDLRDEDAFEKDLQRFVPMKSAQPSGPDDDCSWASPMVTPSSIVPHLTEVGLHFTPQLPHVAKACQYDNLGLRVPRAFAERYVRSGSLLEAALAGEWGP